MVCPVARIPYANAERVAAVIRNLGVSALPVAIYRNYWRVYVGGTATAEQAEQIYAKIKDRVVCLHLARHNAVEVGFNIDDVDSRHRIFPKTPNLNTPAVPALTQVR